MHLANHMLVPLTDMNCQRRLRFENEARFVKWRGEGTGNEYETVSRRYICVPACRCG